MKGKVVAIAVAVIAIALVALVVNAMQVEKNLNIRDDQLARENQAVFMEALDIVGQIGRSMEGSIPAEVLVQVDRIKAQEVMVVAGPIRNFTYYPPSPDNPEAITIPNVDIKSQMSATTVALILVEELGHAADFHAGRLGDPSNLDDAVEGELFAAKRSIAFYQQAKKLGLVCRPISEFEKEEQEQLESDAAALAESDQALRKSIRERMSNYEQFKEVRK